MAGARQAGRGRLLLFAPGLLPTADAAAPGGPAADLPATPSLDRLLRGATARPAPPAAGWANLLARFGVVAGAPYALAAEAPGVPCDGYWLHADPVHLRADRDRLRLFDAAALGIEAAEAAALVAALNDHFGADGLLFVAPTPSRWYLRVEPAPALACTPLALANGRAINDLLPTGADARRLAALLNEAQMLLFQAPVNQARERRGRPMINGIWPWGGGVWRAPAPPAPIGRVLADAPIARGLALAVGLEPERAPDREPKQASVRTPEPPAPVGRTAPDWWRPTPCGATLAVVDGLARARGDPAGWRAALVTLDALVAPALAAWRGGQLMAIELDGGDGRCWHLEPRRPWPVTTIGWPLRRRLTLARLLTADPRVEAPG